MSVGREMLEDHVASLNRHDWVIASGNPYIVITPRGQPAKIARRDDMKADK